MKHGLSILIRTTVILTAFILATIAALHVLEVFPATFAEELALKAMKVLGIVAAASAVGLIAARTGVPASATPAKPMAPSPSTPTHSQA